MSWQTVRLRSTSAYLWRELRRSASMQLMLLAAFVTPKCDVATIYAIKDAAYASWDDSDKDTPC
jgi:hypothetical protein